MTQSFVFCLSSLSRLPSAICLTVSYFSQLTEGCGEKFCSNVFCASNKGVLQLPPMYHVSLSTGHFEVLKGNDAAVVAMKLAKQGESGWELYRCNIRSAPTGPSSAPDDVPFRSVSELEKLAAEANVSGDYQHFFNVFYSLRKPEILCKCFLKPPQLIDVANYDIGLDLDEVRSFYSLVKSLVFSFSKIILLTLSLPFPMLKSKHLFRTKPFFVTIFGLYHLSLFLESPLFCLRFLIFRRPVSW